MEERHTEIREGAGLEESRINREFLDWLRTWGYWIGMALLAFAALYGLNEMRKQRAAKSLDAAFADYYENAQNTQSPGQLIRVATEHAGQGAVPFLARLRAADLYLESARMGVTTDGRIALLQQQRGTGWDGTLTEPEFIADDEALTEMLTQAETLYKRVYEDSKSKGRFVDHTLSALFGLAAVSEMRGTSASEHLELAKTVAADAGYGHLERQAAEMLEEPAPAFTLASLPTRDDVYTPPVPEPEEPELAPELDEPTPIGDEPTPIDAEPTPISPDATPTDPAPSADPDATPDAPGAP